MMMKLGIMKMSETNLAEKAENFDVMDDVKVSTVMNETEVQKTVALNVNDNNIPEGPQTPPKGDNATLENVVSKENVNGDVSNVTPLTFAEVAKAIFTRSPKKATS